MLRSIADLGEVHDRAELFAAVPEWGTRIRFVTPVLSDILKIDKERSALDDSPESNVERILIPIVYAAVNEDGERIFATPEASEWLRSRHFDVLVRLSRVASRVCGATMEEVEESLGESEGTPASE
jgi:hypothetical protein